MKPTMITSMKAVLLGSAAALIAGVAPAQESEPDRQEPPVLQRPDIQPDRQQLERLQRPQIRPEVLPQIQPELQRQGAEIENLGMLERIGEYDAPLRRYRVVRPDGLSGRMPELAARLGEAAGVRFDMEETIRLDEGRIAMRNPDDPSSIFEYDERTGNFLFNAGLAGLREEESTPGLPAEGELAELASGTFERYKNFFEPDGEMRVAHLGGLNMSIPDGRGGSQIFEKLKTVRFQRILGDLPVEGDSRIVAHFGERGALQGLIYQWPEVGEGEELSRRELADPQSLRDRAREKLQQMARPAQRAELTTVDLVLYDDGRGIIEPAYHIVLDRMIDLGEGEPARNPFDFYLPAVQEPQGVYPFMQTPPQAPESGEGEAELPNDTDE